MRERDIFIQALQKHSPAELDVYLNATCGADEELRRRVDQLLAEHRRQESFILDAPPLAMDATVAQSRAEHLGTVVGPYRLLEQIGGGGMGVVYMAEQLRPIQRKVALKIIKPGMDSGQVIARFEAERQALTMMDHPNIARVLDAGTTDTGRPYFVMELVKGIPITDFCDQARLTTRERLELFIQVCHAVQHAHQKGVIHRDLKPTNVLVTLHDDKPVPKVIDFGIAKAAGQALTDRILFTNFAQMLGTPLYMSPEQAQLSGLDVDTRSDVYSLGVLLYELLTGTTPFDKQRLCEAAYDEMRRIIREEDPPNPSTRLSTMGEKLTAISTHRHTEPKKLSRLVRGELDWIVMKALEKQRARRYETANGLGRDVERYLHDEAVQACPPSAIYRLRKFARRHKRRLLAGGFAVVVLVGGVAGAGTVAVVTVLAALLGGLGLAIAGLVHARRERDKALTANEEFRAAIQLLRDAALYARGSPGSLQRINAAARRLDAGWLQDQPEIAAGCRTSLGYGYSRMLLARKAENQFSAALELLRRADGTYPPEAGVALKGMGELAQWRDDPAAAEQYFLQSATAWRNGFGASADISPLFREVASIRETQGDREAGRRFRLEAATWEIEVLTYYLTVDPLDGFLLYERGYKHGQMGQFDEARRDLKRAIELGHGTHQTWYLLVCLQAYLNDREGYRESANQMLERFRSADRTDVAERTAKACALMADSGLDLRELRGLLDRTIAAVGRQPLEATYQLGRGLIVDYHSGAYSEGLLGYRSGAYGDALIALQQARDRDQSIGEADDLLTAACLHRLNRPSEAQTWLRRAVSRFDAQVPKPGTDAQGNLEDYLIFHALRREVEALIGSAAVDTSPSSGSLPEAPRQN